MRIDVLVLAAAAVLYAAPVLAADATAPSTDDPNEIICKTEQAATGSRLGARKTCLTRHEWQDRQKADQEELDRAQSRALDAHLPGT